MSCIIAISLRHIAKKKKKMADKCIRVVVLEGDFAGLSAVGFPLSLSFQLQQNYLKPCGLPDLQTPVSL